MLKLISDFLLLAPVSLINFATKRHLNLLKVATVGCRNIYRPWPMLIRVVGSAESARHELVNSYIQQAIVNRYDVINLTSCRNTITPFTMLESSVFSGRCDKVFTINLTTCKNSDLAGLFTRRRILHAEWEFITPTPSEKMRIFLTELIAHVETNLDRSQRTVIVLEDVIRFHPNEVLLRSLIDACSNHQVTLIFTDGSFANSSNLLLRQSDLILICSLQKGESLPNYIKDIAIEAAGSTDAVTHLSEGQAIISYKNHIHRSFLGKGRFKEEDHTCDLEAANASPTNIGSF